MVKLSLKVNLSSNFMWCEFVSPGVALAVWQEEINCTWTLPFFMRQDSDFTLKKIFSLHVVLKHHWVSAQHLSPWGRCQVLPSLRPSSYWLHFSLLNERERRRAREQWEMAQTPRRAGQRAWWPEGGNIRRNVSVTRESETDQKRALHSLLLI